MRPSSLASHLKKAVLTADDGLLMRGAFFGLLAAACTFLFTDLREMSLASASLPGHDPMKTDAPVLPPALTDGVPQAPPIDPETPSEVLRQPIRFDLLPGGVLKAEGSIDVGAADRFAAEISARGEYVKTVSLNSPGGSVDDALAMSALIREKRLNTIVGTRAVCVSSCPLVFAGGIAREAEKDAILGVHQVFNAGRDKPSADQAMSAGSARPRAFQGIWTKWALATAFGSMPWRRHRTGYTISRRRRWWITSLSPHPWRRPSRRISLGCAARWSARSEVQLASIPAPSPHQAPEKPHRHKQQKHRKTQFQLPLVEAMGKLGAIGRDHHRDGEDHGKGDPVDKAGGKGRKPRSPQPA